MPEAPNLAPVAGARAQFYARTGGAALLTPADFSNRFAVKHTNHNYFHNITNPAIDSTRAHDLSLNKKLAMR